MRNLEHQQWYNNRLKICTLFCVTVTILLFSVGIWRYQRTRSYVQTYCLVKHLFLGECGTIHINIRNQLTIRHCFQPIWVVEYQNFGKSEQNIITGSKLWMESDYINDELFIFKNYKVGIIYPCYHSNALKKVQWKEPKDFAYILLIICGHGSASFCIWLLLTHCRNKRRENSVYHNFIIQNTPPESITSATRWADMRNIRLTMSLAQSQSTILPDEIILETPPPPYLPPMSAVEAEDIPLTPPPLYTPPMTYMRREQDNIPLTPPPDYVLSST